MDAYIQRRRKQQEKLVRDISLATSKINHLTTLMKDVSKEVAKCQQMIETATKQLKELHNEPGID